MNLTQYRAALESYSNYAPTNPLYLVELDAFIAQVYWMVWTYKRWTFAFKDEPFPFYCDLNYERTAAAASVTEFTREVTFNAAVLPLDEFWNWEGQVIELSGVNYEILMVVDNQTIRLKEPYRGATLVDDEDWIIKHSFYYLPEDCVDLEFIGNTYSPYSGSQSGYKGKIIGLSATTFERSNLNDDKTASSADYYINIPSINVPPGEKLVVEPLEDSGNFPDAQYFEFCWAFETAGGRVGPLSTPTILTIPEGQGLGWSIKFTFTSHDDQPIEADTYSNANDTYPNAYEGLRKRIYYNQNFNRTTGERLGLPVWRQIQEYDPLFRAQYRHLPIRVPDEDSEYTLLAIESISPGNPRYIETDGVHQRIKPYPRVDGYDFHYEQSKAPPISEEVWIQFGHIRYFYKPHMLATATDSPQMPYEFHDLLTWQGLADLSNKHGDPGMATMYEKRISSRVRDLKRRYTDYNDVQHQRGRFDAGCSGTYDGPITANGVKY